MTLASQNSATVQLAGELTVPAISAIRTKIAEALQDFDSVEIDCSAAVEIDVSFLQVLIAARQTACDMHRTLHLLPPDNGALDSALARAGISLSHLLTQPDRSSGRPDEGVLS